MGKPLQSQIVILGSMSLGGNIIPVENLAESLQVAFDAGAKRILLPMASVSDIPTIPGELFAKFQKVLPYLVQLSIAYQLLTFFRAI